VTRVAKDGAKYDLELLSAGTRFNLQFELAIGEAVTEYQEQHLRDSLATALEGLAEGEIRLGMRKQRGFGLCKVDGWQVWEYDLTNSAQLFQWLAWKRDYAAPYNTTNPQRRDIVRALRSTLIGDRRKSMNLAATFALRDSLLIRAEQGIGVYGPDVRHLHARQVGEQEPHPVIPGTSLTGVLRHRVERIANTLVPGSGVSFADQLFGFVYEADPRSDGAQATARASRIVVSESRIVEATTDLVQNRIAIDRFTGGAYEGALFNEQPVFARSTPTTLVKLRIDLIEPSDAEIGMLLLVLKDLWTGDLPIGGEASIGRGRLQGREAQLTRNGQLLATFGDNGLATGDLDQLNGFVTTLRGVLQGEGNDGATSGESQQYHDTLASPRT
jgi:CRISPR/Cas system CSM-associated protein Csm3 (group 7 of RAMP superfamily)